MIHLSWRVGLLEKTLFLWCLLLCNFLAYAQFKAGYYDLMDGKSGSDLKVAAKECVKDHVVLNYTSLPDYWIYTDVYPEPYGKARRWWDMYSDAIYLIEENQTGRQSFSANKMQREHCVPKSWWKKDGNVEYTAAYSDLWNLFPSDSKANNAKSNYPLGITQTATFDNGVSKVGIPREGYGGGASRVFEPADEYKGDFARAYMYVATVYDDINWDGVYMYEPATYPTLKAWAIDMLLEWHRNDPVSRKETDRNNNVEQQQGNRNPFIDFPELAEYIWGNRIGDIFYVDMQGGNDPDNPAGIMPVVKLQDDGEPVVLLRRGGFIVRTSQPTGITVYDISGAAVIASGAVGDGDEFSLPKGIYMICFNEGKARKVIITE